MASDNLASIALEDASAVASLDKAELEHQSCGDEVRVSEEVTGEGGKFKEELILDELQAVQDYMDELLKRARGENSPDSVNVPLPRRSAKVPTQAQSETSPAELNKNDVKIDGDCSSQSPITELTPRPKPPESMGWGSMRELANSQARAAIDTHDRIRLEQRMLINGAAGLACLIGTVVALICAPILGQTLDFGRMVGVVASVYFLYASFRSARDWLASRSTSCD